MAPVILSLPPHTNWLWELNFLPTTGLPGAYSPEENEKEVHRFPQSNAELIIHRWYLSPLSHMSSLGGFQAQE
jgi:hypothetical protein